MTSHRFQFSLRTVFILVTLAAALVSMVSLLMHDDSKLWQLVVVGAVAGVVVGGMRWGRRGALICMAAGILCGLLAPLFYFPFWMLFTLPPHPEVDF
jgi:Na+/proline symporter